MSDAAARRRNKILARSNINNVTKLSPDQINNLYTSNNNNNIQQQVNTTQHTNDNNHSSSNSELSSSKTYNNDKHQLQQQLIILKQYNYFEIIILILHGLYCSYNIHIRNDNTLYYIIIQSMLLIFFTILYRSSYISLSNVKDQYTIYHAGLQVSMNAINMSDNVQYNINKLLYKLQQYVILLYILYRLLFNYVVYYMSYTVSYYILSLLSLNRNSIK